MARPGPPLGYKQSPEHIASALAARKAPLPTFAGQQHTQEAKAKIAAGNRRRIWSAESLQKMRAAKTGKRHSNRSKAKMAATRQALVASGQHVNPMKGRRHSAEAKARMSASHRGVPKSPAHRAKLAACNRRRAQDPIAERKRIQASVRGLALHPNRLERHTLALLVDAFPDAGWRFNHGVVIAGKVPDFVGADPSVCVDVHGDYWHAGEDPRARIAAFRRAGIRLVVVWEHDVRQRPAWVVAKIRRASHGVHASVARNTGA